MRVLCAVVLCAAWACGDDDDSGKKDDADASTPAGGSGGLSGGGVDGGIGPDAPGDEGWPCQFQKGECNTGFICVENIFADQNGQAIGVCARECKQGSTADCRSGEMCFSYTGNDADAHCVNLVADEYGVCGVGDTSVCDKKRSCLYFPNSPFGVCVDICSVAGGEADAGADDDGGVSQQGTGGSGGSSDAVTCRSGETCVDGVLSDPMSSEGVCGVVVERGGECGIDVGKYCNPGDICAPEDPDDLMSTPRCFENCGDTGMCKQGQCIVVQQSFAYCM
jgi:hypothetical protein